MVAAFYQKHFGFRPLAGGTDKWLELASAGDGCTIALHKAAVSQKSGAAMKLVFAVADIEGFKKECDRKGLRFGAVHRAGGVEFCNAKDPAGNAIQISNRGLAETDDRVIFRKS